jgi:hypothetical protein
MTRPEVYRAVRGYARKAISAGELWAADLPAGVKAVDLWRTTRLGSVLFFGEATSGLFSFNFRSLHHEDARRRAIVGWAGANGGGVGLDEPYDELVANGPPGIHALGLSHGSEVRLTFGYATAEVATIRVVINDQRIRLHPVGLEGFFSLGRTPQEPATRAVAIGPDGDEIDAPPLVL